MAQIQKSDPSVAILLSTYNGQKYLVEQLDSFLLQSFTNWYLYVSDDGSTDNTLDLLESYCEKLQGRLMIFSGPRKGFGENFLSLINRPEIEADYFAYSDQDDVWKQDKLARAIAWHQSQPVDKPALYGSTTTLVDQDMNVIGASVLFKKPFCFANALIQNVAPGNTMVCNRVTRDLLREIGLNSGVIAHDWLTYMVTSGCGGNVFIDPLSAILYRQHGGNLIGSNSGISAKWVRIKKMLEGELREWGNNNVRALQRIRKHLSGKSETIFNHYQSARNMTLFPRLAGIKRSGIYRQTMLGNIGLALAVLLRKV